MSTISTITIQDYTRTNPDASISEFEHGPATYLFDSMGDGSIGRTLLAVGRPERPSDARDTAYQAGYPAPHMIGARPVDRGHLIPYSGGGLCGPNVFVQDRALNRGWSRQGRAYRALETEAVNTAGAIYFVRPHYADHTDVPAWLDVGLVHHSGTSVRRFRNRYDIALSPREDQLAVLLNGAVSSQVGALGEETAAVFVASELDGIVVAMGDASMPRAGASQDLDLVVVLEGVLVAFEIKTRFLASTAGRRTRAGNLFRPRMRRPLSAVGARQGSQRYVADRISSIVAVDDDYQGVEVRVIAVNFRLMELQQFAVRDSGAVLGPLAPPADCTRAAREALSTILNHRGTL